MSVRLLVGDIGGTNARLELWETVVGEETSSTPDAPSSSMSPPPPPLAAFLLRASFTYASADFGSLASLATRFLAEHDALGLPIHGCCLAMCGPVENEAKLVGPPLPLQPPTQWNACAANLLGVTGIERAVLVNDFVAVGYGLTAVDPAHVIPLSKAAIQPNAPMACVGAGTGLGEVFNIWQSIADHPNGGYYVACASEGGMTDFLAHTEEEWRLRQWLSLRSIPGIIVAGTEGSPADADHGHVTVEGVVSGPGLADTYRFLQATVDAPELHVPSGHKLQYAVSAGAKAGDTHCLKAVDLMLSAWGHECRQLALRVLPFGGVYLAGGLASKLAFRIPEIVPRAFAADSCMGPLLQTVPLFLVTDENVGLLGARVRAHRLLPQ